jgi:hypothetical protein
MNDRQFLWGLSGGVSAFAIAGAFWFGLGISAVPTTAGWPVFALLTAFQAGGCAALLWTAVRLRRKSRFRASELRQVDERQRAETRHMMTGFRWTVAGQMILIGFAVLGCVLAHAEPLIWPSIGLVVSLHLIPLARIFHVRAYYLTAGAGSIISLVAFTGLTDPYRLACLCGGMAVVMWVSAVYLLSNADRIADRAMREPWAV